MQQAIGGDVVAEAITGKSQQTEVARLGQELEQAQVALEDAHAEITALSEAYHVLQQRAETHAAARLSAERAASRAREEATRATEVAAALSRSRVMSEEVDLRNALEEASVLAEELRAANENLLLANEELDQRVAARTAELDDANRKLENLNALLNRRIEQETGARVRAQADLFRIQKMDAIHQLTGGIAHDFNNLLSVVISGLEVLRKLPPERHERILRRTEEAAWRGAHLTQRLLTFARSQVLHPQYVDLRQHMDGLRDLLVHGLREDITLVTEVSSDAWAVEADPSALELALLNLAVNARDAMPKGGYLHLSASNLRLRPNYRSELGLPPNDYVELRVADTGIGMAPEVLEKVFEPFFTTKGSRGTGLGLAQVHGFAKQSAGTAWVESTPGRGTTVALILPRSLRSPPEAANEPRGERRLVRRKQRLHVLVVEDDEAVAAAVLDMLGQLGHDATRVGTVAAALAMLSAGEVTDLVFSDVLLPGGGSGLDLAREIARRGLELPVVLTSGYGGGVTQRLAAANLPFLRKPYRLEALRQVIDTALPPTDPALDVGA